jgi:hypothetical protein
MINSLLLKIFFTKRPTMTAMGRDKPRRQYPPLSVLAGLLVQMKTSADPFCTKRAARAKRGRKKVKYKRY